MFNCIGAFIKSLLPNDAPLSTLRIITASTGSFVEDTEGDVEIKSLSCVFRAGRRNAATDQNSILFNVDTSSGAIKKGTTNQHWYRLGLSKAWKELGFVPAYVEVHPVCIVR